MAAPDAGLRASLAARLLRRLDLRFPGLVLLLAGLTLVDLAVPDALPFVDEIGLAMLTLLLARWKARRRPASIDRPRSM
jgi:hypothetical protein